MELNLSSLLESLKTQEQQLSDLIAVLDQELHLISTRDAEQLFKLLKDKEALLEAIQGLDNDIERWYSKAKEKGELDKDIEQHIEKCKKLIDQCKFRTEVNQTAVENGQLRLEHLRNILTELRAKETLTYDKAGKPHSRATSPVIKA